MRNLQRVPRFFVSHAKSSTIPVVVVLVVKNYKENLDDFHDLFLECDFVHKKTNNHFLGLTFSLRESDFFFWTFEKHTFCRWKLTNIFFLHRRWSSWWAETFSIRWCFLNLWVSERRGWRACVGRKGFLSLRLMVGRRCRSLALASLFPDFSSHRRSYTGDAFLFSVEPRRVCLWSKTNQINHSTTTTTIITIQSGEAPF